MSAAVIGIDPGAGGALALLRTPLHSLTGAETQLLVVEDMPTHEINGKRRVDLHALVALLRKWATIYNPNVALTENVSAMPGQSPNGMFQFGFACAAVQTAIVAADIPMRLVTPQVWKKHYGLKGGKENKDQSRQIASRLFPAHAAKWARVKDDGRAEAVLLAAYGRLQ